MSRLKNKILDFFFDNSTTTTRGTNFVDRENANNEHYPNQSTFQKLLNSIPFFSETTSQAIPDDGNSDLGDVSGIVTLADDATAKTRPTPTDRKVALQAHQQPEVTQETQTITAVGTSLTDVLVETDDSTEPTSHKSWIIRLSVNFINWLQDRLNDLSIAITNTQSGNTIATVTNTIIGSVDINETVTSISLNGTDLEYTKEDGTQDIVPLPSGGGGGNTSSVTGTQAGNTIGTHDDGTGNTTDINETVTSLVLNGDGQSLDYTDESGTTNTLPINETVTSLTRVNDDLIYTNENSVQNTISLNANNFLGRFGFKFDTTNNKISLALINDFIFVAGSFSIAIYDLGFIPRGTFGSNGTADGQFIGNIALASGNNEIYALDQDRDDVQVFDLNGNFLRKWGSTGTADGQLDDAREIEFYNNEIYICDTGNSRIQVFDLNGNFLRKWGTNGTGNGQFEIVKAINIINNEVYTGDLLKDNVQVFDLNGNFLREWGSTYNFSNVEAVQLINNEIVVLDSGKRKVAFFDASEVFIKEFGESGTGDGEFSSALDMVFYNQELFIVDSGNLNVQVFI